jgi:predicted CXXCH cytochrome family protein
MNFVGTHFVTRSFADTSKGGGYETTFPSGGKNITRANRTTLPYYMANMTAAVTAPFVAAPKYGVAPSGVIDNTIDPAATGAQMICESCHNIVKNIGPRKLIADGRANKNAALCVGCHGDMDGAISAEYQLHPLTAGTWSGTHHHRNSHSALSDTLYKGSATQISATTHNMGTMDRAYYPDNNATAPIQMWAPSFGTLGASARPITCTAATNPRMQDGCPDNGQIRVGSNDTGTGGGTIICTNCHRAHNAVSSAGATILMSGVDNVTRIGNIGNPTGVTQANWGAFRMTDQGGRDQAFNTTNPLCLACHK